MATWRVLVGQGVFLFLFCVHTLRSEENTSFGKTTMQSNLYTVTRNWTADNVVDGCLKQVMVDDCCTHTALNQNSAWWQVYLGQPTTISHITIYNRDDANAVYNFQRRFAGYQLYLSNSSEWSQGVLCYQDNSNNWTEVEMVVTHQCPYVAKFVTIYNYRSTPKRHDWYYDDAIIELCEVQVFGCPIGTYGYGDCNNTCLDTCYGGNCDASTGACFFCPPGKWSHSCDQDCSSGCDGCFLNGSCIECQSGKHGDLCDQDCPINCNGTCDKGTGFCRDCVYGKRGDTCDQDCSRNCKDCSQTNGSCIDCTRGKHGNSCELYCPTHCENDACDKDFGFCIECKPGKRGETCDLDCPAKCKDLICERDTGFCSECMDGMYGFKCDKACPAGCDSNKCRRSAGICEDTCPHKDDITTVVVLAVVAGLCLVVAVVSLVYMLRIRATLKTEQETAKEENYAGIDTTGRDSHNTYYEMTS